MDSNAQVALAQVVADVVKQAAILSAVTAPIVYGVGEALKKIKIKGKKLPGWVYGLLTAPVGVLVMFLIQGAQFTPLGILVGVLSGLSTAGAYSVVKSATASE